MRATSTAAPRIVPPAVAGRFVGRRAAELRARADDEGLGAVVEGPEGRRAVFVGCHPQALRQGLAWGARWWALIEPGGEVA